MVKRGTILLVCAVRNEAGFIAKLISSLQTQSYSNWILHIRDNASTDGTGSIIGQLQKDDKRIHMTCGPTPVSVTLSWLYAINDALLTPSEYVSCIAGDDYYERSTHLESLLTALDDLAMCALPQFRLLSDVIDIYMPTKANSRSMRKNHILLAAKEVYVNSYYGLFKRSEFERILKTRSGRWPLSWDPSFDYWFALEALRNAQSVHNETYIKYVKGVGHDTAYYNAESGVINMSPRNVSTKVFAMMRRLVFETFVEPLKLFLSGYKRISPRDLLWIPLFLIVMSASRFGKNLSLSINFLVKSDGFRKRLRYKFKIGNRS
jgi:glycosyltransferase involved in cell wall biosynthesis